VVFFFSSRRRHTIWPRDWSSDVCSSDLVEVSRIFGLIVSELTNPFFPEIVQVFETIAVRHHYEILLTSTMNDPEQMESSVRRMRSEERRVGKECRSRWVMKHGKKMSGVV